MEEAPDCHKYWAFISYSSKDRKWGEWLHKRLENYPIPPAFHGMELFDGAVLGRNLRPVFRDRDELAGSADLGPAIREALTSSRFLIVLCSPNSARSEWVNKEIEDFKELGGVKRILALILEGEPNATDCPETDGSLECFPPALRYPVEPLAGDLRAEGDGKERGFLKVLAGMAQLDFDQLYRRHERARQRRRRLLAAGAVALIGVLSALTGFALVQRAEAERQRQVAEEREEEANVQRGIAVEKQAEAEEQRGIAEKRREEAIESERKTKRALAENDYELAQLYRWQGDCRRAVAHLERCLRNVPDHPFAGQLAWALLTSDKLVFSKPVRALPENRVASAFSREGTHLVWVSDDGGLHRLLLDGDPDLASEKLAQLPDWEVGEEFWPNVKFEPSDSRLHIVLPGADAWMRYEIDVEAASLGFAESFEPESEAGMGRAFDAAPKEDPGKFEALSASMSKAVKEAPDTGEPYAHGRAIIGGHPLVEELSAYYKQCRNFEDLIWVSGGGNARLENRVFVLKSGKLAFVAGAPLVRAVISPKNDLLLVERESYYGNPILEWIDLADPGDDPYANASRTVYSGRAGSRAGFLIDSDESQVLIWVNDRAFLFGAPMDERPSGTVDDDSLPGILDGVRAELVGIDAPDAIHFDSRSRTLLVACGSELRRVVPADENRIVIEESPWTFLDGPDRIEEPIPLEFPGEHEGSRALGDEPADRLSHNRLTELLSPKSLLDRFPAPLFTEHEVAGHEFRIADIDDDWSARNPTARICSVSPDYRHVINRGHWGKFSFLSKDRQIVVTQGPGEGAAFLWPLCPSDDVPPVWLADFLRKLTGCYFDSKGSLILPSVSDSSVSPRREADGAEGLSLDWQSLAARHGFVQEDAAESGE